MKNEITNNDQYTAPYIDTRISTDVTEDFSLADYYPEVKRIIFVTGRAIPEGKFISGEQIDCDGTVAFTVTYLGEDGTVTSVPLGIQYSQSTNLPQAQGTAGDIICIPRVVNPQCRVTSPRSLSLKAHVITRIICYQTMEAGVERIDDHGKSAELETTLSVEEKCTKVPTVRLLYGAYSGELEGVIKDLECARAVNAEAIIDVVEARVEKDRAAVKAQAFINLLCQDEDGRYRSSDIKVPFEAEIPVENAEAGDEVSASALVDSVEVVLNDDGLSYLIEYDIDVQVAKTEYVDICEDAFSTEYESAVTTESAAVMAPLKFTNAHLTQTGELKRHGEALPGEYIMDSVGSAEIEGCTLTGAKLKINGNIKVQSAICQDGEVITEDGNIPFTYECDADIAEGQPVYQAIAEVIKIASRLDGASLIMTVELGIVISALAENTLLSVTQIVIRDFVKRSKDPGIKICFPSDEDSVWSICKKYGCSRRTLEKINGWQEGQSDPGTAPVIVE